MTKFIAHRGFAKRKGNYENTIPAFEDAATSQAWGIETDVRPTKDGVFVTHHDPNTYRTAFKNQIISETDFCKLRKSKIGTGKRFEIPLLSEYLEICKSGSKQAIVELKGLYTQEHLEKLIKEIDSASYLGNTTLISFLESNLLRLRKLLPQQPLQLLARNVDQTLLDFMSENSFDLDLRQAKLTKSIIDEAHSRNMQVNCWVINNPLRAANFQEQGVDSITSDKLDRI